MHVVRIASYRIASLRVVTLSTRLYSFFLYSYREQYNVLSGPLCASETRYSIDLPEASRKALWATAAEPTGGRSTARALRWGNSVRRKIERIIQEIHKNSRTDRKWRIQMFYPISGTAPERHWVPGDCHTLLIWAYSISLWKPWRSLTLIGHYCPVWFFKLKLLYQ